MRNRRIRALTTVLTLAAMSVLTFSFALGTPAGAVVVSGGPLSVEVGEHATFDVSKLDLTSLGSPLNTSLEVQLDGAPLGTFPVAGGLAHVDVVVPIVPAPGARTLTLVASPSGTTVKVPLTVTPFDGALSIATTSLADGVVGSPYSKPIVAVGGTAPYEFSVIGGLPGSLTLDPVTGQLTGTPTAPGIAKFRVTVRDSSRPRQMVSPGRSRCRSHQQRSW